MGGIGTGKGTPPLWQEASGTRERGRGGRVRRKECLRAKKGMSLARDPSRVKQKEETCRSRSRTKHGETTLIDKGLFHPLEGENGKERRGRPKEVRGRGFISELAWQSQSPVKGGGPDQGNREKKAVAVL